MGAIEIISLIGVIYSLIFLERIKTKKKLNPWTYELKTKNICLPVWFMISYYVLSASMLSLSIISMLDLLLLYFFLNKELLTFLTNLPIFRRRIVIKSSFTLLLQF